MLDFKKAEIEDLKLIKSFYMPLKDYSCENTTTNIIVWQNHFGFEFCVFEDMLFTKVKYGKNVVFGIPTAKDMKKAVTLLREYCSENKLPLIFTAAEGMRLDMFKAVFENEFSFTENLDLFEYIYSSEKLATLSGKKYHSKRNHISSFMKKYNWSYHTLTSEHLDEVLAMIELWYDQNVEKSDRFMKMEQEGVKRILENFALIDIKGGFLRVDGKVVAVTFGSEVNSDVFDVSFEKALSGYDGAYTMINNRFVLSELSSYTYVNREDDMGLEGLRKAKLSYKPEILLKKYLIREI